MSVLRLVILLVFSAPGLSAQTTNVLSLCTEPALRAAVGIGGIFQLECTNLITLNQPLVVERDFTLMSTQEVVITGAGRTRLFIVQPGVRLTLQNIALFSGRQTETNLNHGGIPDTAGAGIFNDGGIVTIRNSRLDSHSVVGVTGIAGANGSGDDGEEGGDAAGGAIYNLGGQLVISNTVFAGNSVTGGPGGAGGRGRTSGGNGGDGGNGGSSAGAAIYSVGGSVFVEASTFTNNVARGTAGGAAGEATGFLGFHGVPGEAGDAVGAAIAGADAEIRVLGCTFVTNSVRAADGLNGTAGLRNQSGGAGRNGGEAAGGAIFNTGRLWVTNSTFFGNLAVAGDGGAGGTAGSQGFGSDGGNGGRGGMGSGGAIDSTSDSRVVNCTFSDNVVTGGLGGEGGQGTGVGADGRPGAAGEERGGALYGSSGNLAVANSILAFSDETVAGAITDLGGNLTTDLNGLIVSPTSFRLTNPGLRPLANNGGPTATMGLFTNSLALNRALALYCPEVDQRGTNRAGLCDIGAFELVTVAIVPTNVLSSFTASITTNQQLLLQWPAGYTNLYLQMKTNLLGTNTSWVTVNPSGTTNNDLYTVTVRTTNAARPRAYFRLIGTTDPELTEFTDIILPPSPE